MLGLGSARFASAEGGGVPPTNEGQSIKGSNRTGESKTDKPEEDDYSGTPFTEYGEFNQAAEEEAETKFFQYGRFFGVSLGLGFEFMDGYRGALWQGGFPSVDFKVHYWFDFNLALDLGFTTSTHYYNTTVSGLGHVDVNLVKMGLDLKYYIDTQNLSAPISFASPYLLLGIASFSKTELSSATQNSVQDNSLGVLGGLGLEFTIAQRKTYFQTEFKVGVATFKDTYSPTFTSAGLPNLTGNFYTLTGNVLFVW